MSESTLSVSIVSPDGRLTLADLLAAALQVLLGLLCNLLATDLHCTPPNTK